MRRTVIVALAAVAALAIAIPATAQTPIPDNSVGTDQIINRSIEDVDIAGGELRLWNFTPWMRGTLRDAINTAGAVSDLEQADSDLQDRVNTLEDRTTQKVAADVITVAPGTKGTATSTCPTGKTAVSGGYETESTNDPGQVEVLRDQPKGTYDGANFDAWQVQVRNLSDSDSFTVQVAVVCQ